MRRVFSHTMKMPRECAAMGCKERQNKGSLLSFHAFPKDTSQRKAWLVNMNRLEQATKKVVDA